MLNGFVFVASIASSCFQLHADATTCASPFALKRLVPAVPIESLCQLHAPFTPVAAYPVLRSPAGFSQRFHSPLVLTTPDPNGASSEGLLSLVSLTRTRASIPCTLPPMLTTMALNHSRLR